MNVGTLPLPVRFAATPHFKTAYAQAHRAGELLSEHVHAGVCVPDDFTAADSKELVRLLSEALCAARALDNLLVGNPPPRKGD